MTNKAAIEKWLEGVTNAAFEFRPLIYKTNAIPSRSDILSALQALSRLAKFGGFIAEDIEELYAQQVQYAIEHMSRRVWGDAQCAAARDAITETLSTYLHYDPSIGNGVPYQTKCFYKTLRMVDKAYEDNKNTQPQHGVKIEVWQKAVPCCLTPYYKHTVIKDPDAQPTFKYVPHNQRTQDPNNGYVKMRENQFQNEEPVLPEYPLGTVQHCIDAEEDGMRNIVNYPHGGAE